MSNPVYAYISKVKLSTVVEGNPKIPISIAGVGEGSTYLLFGLVWFYGISSIVGDLMPNPVYIY